MTSRGWLGRDLDKRSLCIDLSPKALAAIDRAMERVRAQGLPFHEIRKRHFADPDLDGELAAVLREIRHGLGIVILRGFSVDKYGDDEMQAVFWGVGTHFGLGCSQSADGDYLGHVTDVGKNSRGYTTSRELKLHTDSAEIVGLLCLRQAREGGLSVYASSHAVYGIIAGERPECLPVLERGFRCDRRGEEAPEDDLVTPYRVPVFAERDGVLSCRYVRGVIDRGAQTLGQELSSLERDALAFFEEVAARPEVRLELMLEPGEASFIDNFRTLHARTEFVDWEAPGRKRPLYRLWLEGQPPRPMPREMFLYQNRSGHQGVDPQPGRGPR